MDKINAAKRRVELTKEYVIGPGNDIIRETVDSAMKAFNDFMAECFARYGFTKEWLSNPDNAKHVNIRRYYIPGKPFYTYYAAVYSCELFKVVTEEDEGRSITYSMIPFSDPTEIKKLFGFPVEEAADESD